MKDFRIEAGREAYIKDLMRCIHDLARFEKAPKEVVNNEVARTPGKVFKNWATVSNVSLDTIETRLQNEYRDEAIRFASI